MELPKEVLQRQAEQEREDQAAKEAAGTPLPGPTADAFAPQPDIKVGPYSVRPFCDADFETLQFLDNPMIQMMALSFEGKDATQEVETIVRKVSHGQHAWDIAFVMTTPAEEVDSLLKSDGVAGLKAAAKKKFGNKISTGGIAKLVGAAISQMNKSWETMLSFGAPKSENGEAASSSPNPSESGAALTA